MMTFLYNVMMQVPSTPVLHPGLNNVYGRAKFKKDSGVTRFLGVFQETKDCAAACIGFLVAGQRCYSFTHHLQEMPTDWRGLCYGVVDHSWKPAPDGSNPPIITSGRVAWHEETCGAGALQGCTWQLDPWCLNSKYAEKWLTTDEAAAACASDSKCVGFTLAASGPTANVSFSATPLMHDFHSTTDGSPGGCWARRRHFAFATDPYRTGFHYQPSVGSWMNDPNGPMFFGGLYHLFYQWNPISTDAYNMHWGHAVSSDLVRWTELPFALAPDHGACGGEWSGSATPDASIGSTAAGKQSALHMPILSYSVQCNSYFGQASPANLSDPLLLQWIKRHPTATKPRFVPGGFRDPSQAWLGADGVWRQLAACTGGACLFNSTDFIRWQPDGYAVYPYGPPPGQLHAMPQPTSATYAFATEQNEPSLEGYALLGRAKQAVDAGNPPTWECPDLFVLPPGSRNTARTATPSSSPPTPPLWVFKASGGLTPATRAVGVDFWATGTFSESNGTFVHGPGSQPPPSDTQRCDFGQFYASKTFFDPVVGERIIFGWVINYAGGAEERPPLLEWNGIQSSPRRIREDALLPGRLTFYPVDALRSLRSLPPAAYLRSTAIPSHTESFPLPPSASGPRLDLELVVSAPFSSKGMASFGMILLGGAINVTVDQVGADVCGPAAVGIQAACANLTVGSHHGPFILPFGTPLELRILVDGSVVEAFAAGGRAAVTARVYPATDAPLTTALFNHGSAAIKVSSFEAYVMMDAHGPTLSELLR